MKRADGLDYLGNPILGTAFDAALKSLADDPKNAEKPARWFLKTAHARVKEVAGGGAGRHRSRDGDLDDKNIPGRDHHREPRGDLSHLDELEEMDLEAAIADMSPEEEECWLRT